MNIPFSDSLEIKKNLSGFDRSFDLDNVRSYLITAATDIQKDISEPVYNRLVDYYNSGTFNPDTETTTDDTLCNLLQFAIANLGMYHAFPFLMVRISNAGITSIYTDTEKTISQTVANDLRNTLLDSASGAINRIIVFLNQHKTDYPEWIASEIYLSSINNLIDYPTFSRIYQTDNIFFLKLRYEINDIIEREIQPRFENFDDFMLKIIGNTLSSDETMLLSKIQKAIVYCSVANACETFDYEELPSPLRKFQPSVYAMNDKKASESYLRAQIAPRMKQKATDYLRLIDEQLDKMQKIKAFNDNPEEVIPPPKPEQGIHKFVFIC